MESQRCPGNELNKSLTTYTCDCPSCGKENEIFGDEMNTNFGKIYASPELISKNLKLMWVSCGTDDGLCSAAKALDKALTDRNIVHEAHFTDGAHTWMNCRKYIAEVAKKIFR